jgi:hypothetical protein
MSDTTTIEFGQSYDLITGKKHELGLPPDWMTISFLVESGSVDVGYPKYVLKSSDGAYDKTLTAKDDMVPGDKYLQLKFEKLLPGKKYTLTVFDDAEISREIFANVGFNDVVDQERSMHDHVVEHGYAELTFEDVTEKIMDDWSDDGAA